MLYGVNEALVSYYDTKGNFMEDVATIEHISDPSDDSEDPEPDKSKEATVRLFAIKESTPTFEMVQEQGRLGLAPQHSDYGFLYSLK